MPARVGRCVCGVAISLHFDSDNRKISCEAARERLVGPARDNVVAFGPSAWTTAPARVLPFSRRVTRQIAQPLQEGAPAAVVPQAPDGCEDSLASRAVAAVLAFLRRDCPGCGGPRFQTYAGPCCARCWTGASGDAV